MDWPPNLSERDSLTPFVDLKRWPIAVVKDLTSCAEHNRCDESVRVRHGVSEIGGLDVEDRTSRIDFMKAEYVYPKVHCLAARITAENPDDAFKPTGGKIERIKRLRASPLL